MAAKSRMFCNPFKEWNTKGQIHEHGFIKFILSRMEPLHVLLLITCYDQLSFQRKTMGMFSITSFVRHMSEGDVLKANTDNFDDKYLKNENSVNNKYRSIKYVWTT